MRLNWTKPGKAQRSSAPIGFVQRGTFVALLRSFLREPFTLIEDFPNGERIFTPKTREEINPGTMKLTADLRTEFHSSLVDLEILSIG